MNNVVVVGSLNMDFAIEVKEMPKAGETILGKEVSLVPGGKGANQAYAIGKMGKQVQMIGAVGNDLFGRQLIENLNRTGVETKGIRVLDGVPSGQAFININEDGENNIVVIQGANQELSEAWINQNLACIESCDAVVMQLEIPVSVVTYVARKARDKGKLVFLDPAPASFDLPDELYQCVTIIKPNRTELETLTGEPTKTREEVVAAARKLIDKGVEHVIVTLGGEGSLYVTRDFCQSFCAEPVKALDTTAAGDSYTAGFIAALENNCFQQAIEFAGQVAAISVTRKGAQTSVPNLEEVQKELQKKADRKRRGGTR